MTPRRDPAHELALGLRALADENRLRLMALLARRPHYGEELAEVLGLAPATVSHHLKQLRAAGLVDVRRESPYVLFHRVDAAFEELLDRIRSRQLARALRLPDEEDVAARLLRRHLDDDGKVGELPSSRRARAALLRWVAGYLETDRLYPERELRLVLLETCRDPEAIRDALLEQGWLHRSGQVFRRVEEVDAL